MKRTMIFLGLLAASLPASPLLQPVMSPDGQGLDPSAPGLGQKVFALPGSIWEVWFNDNWNNSAPGEGFGDFDFNDAVGRVTFNPLGTEFLLEYLGAVSSDDTDTLALALPLPLTFNTPLEVGQSRTYGSIPGLEVVFAMVG